MQVYRADLVSHSHRSALIPRHSYLPEALFFADGSIISLFVIDAADWTPEAEVRTRTKSRFALRTGRIAQANEALGGG